MTKCKTKIKLLCIVLSLALMTVPTGAFAADTVRVSVEDAELRPGERVEIGVWVENNPGISGAGFTVSCPDEGIVLLDIQPVSSGSFSKNLNKGSFSWLKGSNVYGDFQLVTLTLEAAADAEGEYEIKLRLTGGHSGNLTNAAMEEVPVAFGSGTLKVTVCDGGEGCPSGDFDDLKTDAWYHHAVDFVISKGIMKGVGGGSFAPDMTVSRATAVTVLYRLSGEEASGQGVYSDVKPGLWYSDAVSWATEKGIVEG